MGWDGMGWDGTGWDEDGDGTGRHGMGLGWDGMGWDGMGWDGTGRDGMGWDGMGWASAASVARVAAGARAVARREVGAAEHRVPIRQQIGGCDNQYPAREARRDQRLEQRDHLQGLAHARVVGQDAATAGDDAEEPLHALGLQRLLQSLRGGVQRDEVHRERRKTSVVAGPRARQCVCWRALL